MFHTCVIRVVIGNRSPGSWETNPFYTLCITHFKIARLPIPPPPTHYYLKYCGVYVAERSEIFFFHHLKTRKRLNCCWRDRRARNKFFFPRSVGSRPISVCRVCTRPRRRTVGAKNTKRLQISRRTYHRYIIARRSRLFGHTGLYVRHNSFRRNRIRRMRHIIGIVWSTQNDDGVPRNCRVNDPPHIDTSIFACTRGFV